MLALVLLSIFLLFAYLMYSGRMAAMIALPLFAISLTIFASLPFFMGQAPEELSLLSKLAFSIGKTLEVLSSQVLAKGVKKLSSAIITVILGGLFAQLLRASSTADALLRSVAELAGDNGFAVSFVLGLVMAFLFTALGGLGSVILLANISFPILLSLGLPPLFVACQFLMAMSLGGVFNLVNWKLYLEILGMEVESVAAFALPFAALYLLVFTVFNLIECRRAKIPISARSLVFVLIVLVIVAAASLALFYRVENSEEDGANPLGRAFALLLLLAFVLPHGRIYKGLGPILAGLSPAVPILLVLLLGVDINASLILGILFLLRCSGAPQKSRLLLQSATEGIKGVAPAIAIMMGIGMLVVAVWQDAVVVSLSPVLKGILPSSKSGFVLFFGLLAPLSLYRGPLNIWGMGSGLLKLLQASSLLSSFQIMTAFMSTGQIQGVCDPTNTHNVWIANQLQVETRTILKRCLPYIWVLALAGLILGAIIE